MIVPLTSLRGFAALAVVGFHFAPLMAGIPIFSKGFLGVDLFFLLSGFILTTVYSKELNVRSFFVARAARTYPLHLFTLAVLLPCFGRAQEYSADSPRMQPHHGLCQRVARHESVSQNHGRNGYAAVTARSSPYNARSYS